MVLLGAALGLTVLGFVVFGNLGRPSVPDDAVAVVEGVENGTVGKRELASELARAFRSQDIDMPPEGDPQLAQAKSQVLDTLIQKRWFEGEAADRGIEVSDQEVEDFLEEVGPDQVKAVKEQGGYDDDEIDELARFAVLQEKVLDAQGRSEPDPNAPPNVEVSDRLIEKYYETTDAFDTPASRDVRVVLNSDEDKASEALKLLEADDSEDNWTKVAKRLSQDQASKSSGGLLTPVTEGLYGDEFDKQVFGAGIDEFVGPFETERGFYVAQVVKITKAGKASLDEVRAQIEARLAGPLQQLRANDAQSDFTLKWLKRTNCIEKYRPTARDQEVAQVEQDPAALLESPVPSCPEIKGDSVDEAARLASATPIEIPPPVQAPPAIAPGSAALEIAYLLGEATPPLPQRPKQVGDPCQDPDDPKAVEDPCGPNPTGGQGPPPTGGTGLPADPGVVPGGGGAPPGGTP